MHERWSVKQGDCRDVMRAMPQASVDAIVSDPPYGLAFMGKGWDHAVPGVEFWAEALRVAKPGAHLVAFGGTRTFHRLAVAIEDAGWEIRDCLSWLHGQGFPKSLDVGKAIDKMDAAEEQMARRYRFTAWVRSTGVTAQQIDAATRTFMGNHYTTHPTQPAIMTSEHLEACRHLLGNVPEWVERECDIRSVESRNFAEREVVGVRQVPKGHAFAGATYGNDSSNVQHADTAPATDLARQWHGWGTALKPAYEPIILARKPLTGTVAANVAQHGTGALNVDGCRIGTDDTLGRLNNVPSTFNHKNAKPWVDNSRGLGRWPANVCLDEDAAAMLGEPSRFFYTAKASRREREAGLDGMPLTVCRSGLGGEMPTDDDGRDRETVAVTARNVHPTVKPIALMRWLCRLVTPPGGLILDPFTGSGTTGCAAVLEGFRFHGAELDAEYADIARRRIAYWAAHADADAKQPTQLDLAPLADADPPA